MAVVTFNDLHPLIYIIGGLGLAILVIVIIGLTLIRDYDETVRKVSRLEAQLRKLESHT